MTDESSHWSREQMQAIHDWLKSKAIIGKLCPMCEVGHLSLAGSPAHLIVGDPNGATLLGSSYPCFVMICHNCGHTLMFNSITAGVQKLPGSSEGKE